MSGINVGGWGLRITTEDMAKFALFFLQKGKWEGKQLLSEEWIRQASSAQIMQNPEATMEMKKGSDWLQGYGFQMWKGRNGTFRGDGAFGQLMLVFPEQNSILAVTAETADMQAELNLIYEFLLPALQGADESNTNTIEKLTEKANSLQLKPLGNSIVKAFSSTYTFQPNTQKYEQVKVQTIENQLQVSFTIAGKQHTVIAGNQKWNESTTEMQIPGLTAAALENTKMLYPTKTASSFQWNEEGSLTLKIRFTETPHSENFIFTFAGDSITLDIEKSKDFGSQTIHLIGQKQQ